MATVIWLALCFLLPPSNSEEAANQFQIESCDIRDLEKDFNVESCLLNNKPVSSHMLIHGSTCSVKCKSQVMAADMRVTKYCHHSKWVGIELDCDVDTTPPSLKCPSDLTSYNVPLQTHANFTWIEPEAWDNMDGKIKPARGGPGPGRLFAANATIRYVARDSSGNMASCSVRLNIIVVRCPPPQKIANGYYRCHPSTDFVMGGNCVFGCYNGFELKGASVLTCQNTWRWSDGFPVCKEIECPLILPVNDATMHCNDGFKFRSVCTFSCSKAGYGIPVGQRRTMVCKSDGTWRGHEPSCVDITSPIFTQCPSTIIATAERSSNKTRVVWARQSLVDNSGENIEPIQIKGKLSGSEFSIGYHEIEYTAMDSAGNSARKCQFKIIVKEFTCHALYATLYQTVTCPQGYRYGSECTFECDPDFSLHGSPITSCEITGNPSYGVWSFPKQPMCKVASPCPKLRPPAHGAIVCDEWYQGIFCQLQCQNGTEISSHFPNWELFVCGQSGLWNLQTDLHLQIPDCVARDTLEALTNRVVVRYYFNGNCNDPDVQWEIKTSFISKLENHPACQNVAECKVGNVKVHCGENRKKRGVRFDEHDQVRRRRNSNEDRYVEIEVEFEYSPQSVNKSSVDEWKSRVNTVTNDTVHSTLTAGGVPLTSGSVTTDEIEGECGNGSAVDYRTMSCIKCSAGSFHNVTANRCDLCPEGQYQDQMGQLSCKDCPLGKTTWTTGSKDKGNCQAFCLSGTFSKTGLAPCSPCSPGFYQPKSGQSQCAECPGMKTTMTQGTMSADLCQDFDISFQSNDASVLCVAILDIDINVTSYATISMWLQCTNNCQNTSLLTVDINPNENWFILEGETNLTLSSTSSTSKSNATLNILQWHFVVCELTTSSVTLWVDGSVSGHLDIPGFAYINIQKLTLGGKLFTGRVSQVQIWSPAMSVSTLDRTCSGSTGGDILSWKHFTVAKLQGAFIDIPSTCDEVDDCESSPCVNGRCQDDLGSFLCHCNLGWSGNLCEVNDNDCVENICENNGTCVDDVNAFHCICPESFTGEFCVTAIVDGLWGIWSSWTSCDVTCGRGTRTRSRLCDNPYPVNDGKECEGEATQIVQCQQPECNVCPNLQPPTNGDISCDVTPESYRCNILCEEGYMFDKEPLDQYTCSADTLNTQSHVTELNPLGRLPYCSKLVAAKRLSVVYSASYLDTDNMSCLSFSDGVFSMTEFLSNIMKTEIGCIGSQLCHMSEVKVSICQGHTKPQIPSKMSFSVEISVDTGTQESASVLETAYIHLQQIAVKGLFTIYVGNVAYRVDLNTTSSKPSIYCDPGHTTYSFWCLPCGPGSYYKDGVCEWCPAGTYQSREAQLSCVTCVQGWTTIGYGSRTVTDCNVEHPSNSSSTNDMTKNLMYQLTSALSGAVLIIIVIIAVVYRRMFKNSPTSLSSKSRTSRLSADSDSAAKFSGNGQSSISGSSAADVNVRKGFHLDPDNRYFRQSRSSNITTKSPAKRLDQTAGDIYLPNQVMDAANLQNSSSDV